MVTTNPIFRPNEKGRGYTEDQGSVLADTRENLYDFEVNKTQGGAHEEAEKLKGTLAYGIRIPNALKQTGQIDCGPTVALLALQSSGEGITGRLGQIIRMLRIKTKTNGLLIFKKWWTLDTIRSILSWKGIPSTPQQSVKDYSMKAEFSTNGGQRVAATSLAIIGTHPKGFRHIIYLLFANGKYHLYDTLDGSKRTFNSFNEIQFTVTPDWYIAIFPKNQT